MTQYTSDDQRVEMKESKKINKYLDLAREMENLSSATVIPIIVCTLEIIPKRLERRMVELEIRERIKAIQTTALLIF